MYDMMRFFQALSSAPTSCADMEAGAVSLKKPHHIITLRFSEAVKDHAIYFNSQYFCDSI